MFFLHGREWKSQHQFTRNVTRTRRTHMARSTVQTLLSELLKHGCGRGVSPSTPNPPRCSRRERPKDLAALQANSVLQRRNQACLTGSCSCGGFPAGLRFRQLTHEISSLIGPSPTYFATQHHQTRSAAPWAGQLRVFSLVSTLATCTPVTSDRRHQGCVHCELRAMEQRKSVCHNLNLPVVDPPWRKEIEISHADVD